MHDRVAVFETCSNIQKAKLVRTAVVVDLGDFDRIASVDEIYEIYALYHSAVIDIETGDYSFCEIVQIYP